MNLETVSASEDETSVVTEQEETQDTEAFTSETDAQQTETEQTSEQFTSETETETSAETEEQIPDSIEVEKLEKEIQEATSNGQVPTTKLVEYVDESGNAIEGAPETIELGKISDHSELNISDKDYEFKSAKVNDADCSFIGVYKDTVYWSSDNINANKFTDGQKLIMTYALKEKEKESETSGTEDLEQETDTTETKESETETSEKSSEFDIDFYVIIDGNKVKLQHNDITGIATWKDGRTTYYGVSIEDLLLIYEEFGFVKNGENQNPDANNKFVSAYRGKSRIEYGEVYTDTKSGKTYVSYNYGQNKQGEAVDVYYLPNGKGVALNLKDSVKKDNSFYSVEVKGEGQDRIRYALTGTVVEEAVADFNPKLPDQTDQIEWTCMGTDDKVIDGIRESGNQTRFAIGKITQSYVIQRADQTAFDIQFYIYVDNEVRKLPADSLKKVYKWNRQGRCYLSVSDLAEIYREFGLNAEETQSGHYFPYTVRGEKTLAQATVVTYKGQQYVSYNLDKQEATVPTDVYYMPKGASDGEKIPDNDSDQIKQNKNSFYSVTVINPDGNRTVSYYKKDSAVTISVDPGDTKESDWLCASEDENKTISPVKQGDKLTFSIGKIEQPYTVACNTFAPATLNIKFYTFVNNERYNVLNEEIPVIKDTTTKPGTVYYYISNDELKKHFEKFHYDGSIQNGAKERFYYSKRDYDTIHNAGKYTIEGHECIYIGKSGEPMDVYYLPDGQDIATMSAKTLLEHDDDRYNGFYSVTVQDDDGQVYSQTALRDLPAIDFVARKSTLTRTVSTKPRVEEQTQDINWECREEDGTLSHGVKMKQSVP